MGCQTMASFLKPAPKRRFLAFELHTLDHNFKALKPLQALCKMLVQRGKYLIEGKGEEMNKYLISDLGLLFWEKKTVPSIDNEDVDKRILYESEKIIQELNSDRRDSDLEEDNFNECISFENLSCCNNTEHTKISTFLKPIPRRRYMDMVKQLSATELSEHVKSCEVILSEEVFEEVSNASNSSEVPDDVENF